MRLVCLFILAALSLWTAPAAAHPHIFVRYRLALAPAEKGFINLHFTFTFNGVANPLLTPGAQAGDMPLLQRDMLANLDQHPFFLYLDINGRPGAPQKIAPVAARDDKGQTIYVYDLSLPDSLDDFSVALYDPTYFDTVQLADGAALQAKLDQLSCDVQTRTVAKTVWGPVPAQFIICGGKNQPRHAPPLMPKQLPGEMPDNPGGSALHAPDMLP